MSNFIKVAYGVVSGAGIDTKNMTTEEVVEKFKELSGGDAGWGDKAYGGKSYNLKDFDVEGKEYIESFVDDLEKTKLSKDEVDKKIMFYDKKISEIEKYINESLEDIRNYAEENGTEWEEAVLSTIEEKEQELQQFKEELKFYKNYEREIENAKKGAYEFLEIAEEEGFIVTKSPYGNSFYAHDEDDEIDWGSKPDGSYRFSDHWGFKSRGETHALLEGSRGFQKKWVIAKYSDIWDEYKNI